MGLFSGSAPIDIAPALEAVVVASNDKARKVVLKVLAKSQDGIRADLEPGEQPICIAYYMGSAGGNNILLVTDRRSIEVKKGKFRRQLRHAEVGGTTLGHMPNGDTLVQIESSTARLDYGPNDPERFEHIIQIQVGTPRVANAICAAVDQFL